MRVLHVYSGNLYGGVETILVSLARSRNACPDMESCFALCYEGRLATELRAEGADLTILPPARARNPLSIRRVRAVFGSTLDSRKPDVVVCHSSWSQAIFGPVARARNLPLVFWQHDAVTGRTPLDRWAARTSPDLAICNSHFTAQSLPNLYPSCRGDVIYCPVQLEPDGVSAVTRIQVRAELSTSERDVVIMQASRMESWKGHVEHLRALSKIAHVSGWTCWIAGGAQRPHEIRFLSELRGLANQLGIADRIEFLGARADVPRLLAAADILCQPNTRPEPFGLTFIEALTAGLPVVTSALGGALEIVDATCGRLVPAGDVEELASVLAGLIRDGDLRSRLGRGGIARARALCDPATQLSRLNDSLQECVAGHMAAV